MVADSGHANTYQVQKTHNNQAANASSSTDNGLYEAISTIHAELNSIKKKLGSEFPVNTTHKDPGSSPIPTVTPSTNVSYDALCNPPPSLSPATVTQRSVLVAAPISNINSFIEILLEYMMQ